MVKNQKHVKIPQRFFNPELVKNEAKLEFSQLLGKKVYMWKDLMFRNGFFYHRFLVSKLIHENVCPMIDEVRRFQIDLAQLKDNGGYSSDIDEWDILRDKTVLKTVRNDTQLQIQIGDRCEVVQGQFKGCKGTIIAINDDNSSIVTMNTLDKVPIKIKVAAKELRKFFTLGESVRILQGVHAGEPGQILEVSKEQTHARVLMENTKAELKVLISNLRRNEELDAHCKNTLAEFLTNGKSANVAKSIYEQYNVGDLVLFDNL